MHKAAAACLAACLGLALLLVAMGVRADEPRFRTSDARSSFTGLRASSTRVDGSDADALDHSISLAARSFGYAQDGLVSAHREQYGQLGGGSAGFEGEIGSLLRGGIRLPVAPTHGPLLRGGLQFYVGGNDLLYHSMLELPHAQLGYQLLADDVLFEASAHGGFTLLGHFSAGKDAERSLGQVLDWGAALALHVEPVRIDLWWRRFQVGDGGAVSGPVDTARAQLCASAWYVGVCSEGRLAFGELQIEDGPGVGMVTARQLLFTVGIVGSRARNEVRGRD